MKQEEAKGIGILMRMDTKTFDRGAFHMIGTFVHVTSEGLRNVTDSYDSPRRELDCIEVNVHGSKHYDRPEIGTPSVSNYLNHPCADMNRCASAAKVLAKVGKTLMKIRTTDGHTDDWVQILVRHMKAFGVSWVAFQTTSRGSWALDSEEYKYMTVGGATYEWREMFKAHVEAHNLTMVA